MSEADSTPTLAVAIKAGADAAPDTIIASGRGALAEQILHLAFAHNVKVRQDADLATLLTALDLDTPIPAEALLAVADILARVFAANAATKDAAATKEENPP